MTFGDPYLQSDGRTLKNKVGIEHDPDLLSDVETLLVERRTAELDLNGLLNAKGLNLLKAIHAYLFQDIYDWAGQPRITPLFKAEFEGSLRGTHFLAPEKIEGEARRIFRDLAADNHLQGLSPTDFTERLSDYFSRVNMLHAFREGNGRAQRVLWEHVAQQAGFVLDFNGITRERMVTLSIAGGQGDLEPIRRMFAELLDAERHRALLAATRFLASAHQGGGSINWNERYIATTTPGQEYKGMFAGAGGKNFLLGAADRIYIGNLEDLPERGAGLSPGTQISFRAGGPPAAKPERHAADVAKKYWTSVAQSGPASDRVVRAGNDAAQDIPTGPVRGPRRR